jgi:hypothetical protein
VWSEKVEAILESEKYETLTVDELYSTLKSSEVDRGVRARIENPTDPHSLALVSRPRTKANMASRQFSLSCLVSMPNEEFEVLSEEDLASLSEWFERMYTNWKNTRRNSSMCYQCGNHGHFIAECPKAMEVKPEHKHRPRTDHKHRSRDDHKNKNKSERRPRKGGGQKKERTTSARALATLHRAQVMKMKTGTRASSQVRTSTACASPPKAFAAWHTAPQARRATRMTWTLTPRMS